MRTGFSSTVRIRVPPEQVFWFLADPSTAPVIDPAVVSYAPDGGTMGLGVQNRLRLRSPGSAGEAHEPDNGVGAGRADGVPLRQALEARCRRWQATASSRAHEGTDYTWSMEFTPTGFGGTARWLPSVR